MHIVLCFCFISELSTSDNPNSELNYVYIYTTQRLILTLTGNKNHMSCAIMCAHKLLQYMNTVTLLPKALYSKTFRK